MADAGQSSQQLLTLRLRPKWGLISASFLLLVVLTIAATQGSALDAFWPWLPAIALFSVFARRAASRKVVIDGEGVRYRGSTPLADRTFPWEEVESATISVEDSRSSSFVTFTPWLLFRWLSLLIYGRRAYKLELVTAEFETLRIYDIDTKRFWAIVEAVMSYVEVDDQLPAEEFTEPST